MERLKFNNETTDVVNHPKHYESGKFECIEVMEETQGVLAVMGFCICNAFKYLYRHKRKNGIEDVKKAKWYIDKYIELAEKTPAHEGVVVAYHQAIPVEKDNTCICCGAVIPEGSQVCPKCTTGNE